MLAKITPSCCLSEKWRIFNLLDDIWMLYPRWNHCEVGEGRSVTSVVLQSSELLTASFHDWRQFQTTGTAIRGANSGRPRGTTPADDRYIVLQARKETGGRQREKSLDTRHRRLDNRYRVLPWPEDSMTVVCLHDALYCVYL
ncbi:hypothetical protein TNCV_165981 [Trichonephila clavipes]|nr:hypothetical protein TNCV_165981 [Trichonephila clavipes]